MRVKNERAQRTTCPTVTPLQTLHGLPESELRASALRNRRPPSYAENGRQKRKFCSINNYHNFPN